MVSLVGIVIAVVVVVAIGITYSQLHRSAGQHFDSNGVPSFYSDRGKGEPVILVHGFGAHGDTNFRNPGTVAALAKNYRVIVMDARGHGRSGKPDQGYDLTTMTNDLVAFTQYLKLERPVIIGHSMGGSMCARALATNPELFRAGVLIDPAFRDATHEETQNKSESRRKEFENLKKLSHREIIDISRSKHPGWTNVDIEAYAMSKILFSCLLSSSAKIPFTSISPSLFKVWFFCSLLFALLTG